MAQRTVDRVDLDAPLAHGVRVPEHHPSARVPIERLLDRFMPRGEDVDPAFLLRPVDLCHLGFWLGLTAYFLPEDARLRSLAEAVRSAQYEGGGWIWVLRRRDGVLAT